MPARPLRPAVPFQALRLLLVACLLAVMPHGPVAHAAAADEADALKQGFADMARGDWASALSDAGPAGSIGRDLIEWHRLRAGQGDFGDYLAFLSRRPNWPGLPYLMKRGEETIDDTVPAAAIHRYFMIEPPQTGAGVVAAVRADLRLGLRGDAEATAVLAWRSMSLTQEPGAGPAAAVPETAGAAPGRPAGHAAVERHDGRGSAPDPAGARRLAEAGAGAHRPARGVAGRR